MSNMSNMSNDLSVLRDDFIRYSKMHSWYKHLPLNDGKGIIFYFYKDIGQQIRNVFDNIVEDSTGEHYHFTSSTHDVKNKKYGTVWFGPFLQGSSYGVNFIEEDNKDFAEWMNREYPKENQKRSMIKEKLKTETDFETVKVLLKQLNSIDNYIASCERERYWERLVNAYKNYKNEF